MTPKEIVNKYFEHTLDLRLADMIQKDIAAAVQAERERTIEEFNRILDEKITRLNNALNDLEENIAAIRALE